MLYTYASEGRGKVLKLASGTITISVLVSWLVFAASSLFCPSKAILVLRMLFSLSYPVTFIRYYPWGLRIDVVEASCIVILSLAEMGKCAAFAVAICKTCCYLTPSRDS